MKTSLSFIKQIFFQASWFGYLVPSYIISTHIATPRVLLHGHSFIRRVGQFDGHRSHLDRSFLLSGATIFWWQGKGGHTVAMIQDDLHMV